MYQSIDIKPNREGLCADLRHSRLFEEIFIDIPFWTKNESKLIPILGDIGSFQVYAGSTLSHTCKINSVDNQILKGMGYKERSVLYPTYM